MVSVLPSIRRTALTTFRSRGFSSFSHDGNTLSPALLVGGYLVLLGRYSCLLGQQDGTTTTACDAPTTAATLVTQQNGTSNTLQPVLDTTTTTTTNTRSSGWRSQLYRACKMLWRGAKLAITLAPIAIFYPIYWWNQPKQVEADSTVDAQDKLLLAAALMDKNNNNMLLRSRTTTTMTSRSNVWVDWYFRVCLSCVEASGAAVIKLLQWASCRPDMFGYEFCAIFSKLQDQTTPHSWHYTNQVLQQTWGVNWSDHIQLDPVPLGSGCIGQVYRGTITGTSTTRSSSSSSNNRSTPSSSTPPQEVAVKVLHPNVHDDIESDLDLMRFWVRISDKCLGSSFSFVDLPQAMEEFGKLLTLQLDLRTEAANLQRFNQNFANVDHIVFPQLVPEFPPTRDVLVETFHEGIPVLQFAREHQHDRRLLSDLCFKAMECVCKMIFLDNFLHGA